MVGGGAGGRGALRHSDRRCVKPAAGAGGGRGGRIDARSRGQEHVLCAEFRPANASQEALEVEASGSSRPTAAPEHRGAAAPRITPDDHAVKRTLRSAAVFRARGESAHRVSNASDARCGLCECESRRVVNKPWRCRQGSASVLLGTETSGSCSRCSTAADVVS